MQPENNRREHRGPVGGHKDVRKVPHSRPSGAWRKSYKCKKNKGDHTFILTKGSWGCTRKIPQDLPVTEHYLALEAERDECLKKQKKDREKGILRGWCAVMYHYECTACGRKDVSMNKRKYGL